LYRFLPEEVFVSKTFHACLLAGQLVVLTCCASYWWRFLTTYAKLKAGGPPSQRCNCLAALNVDPDPGFLVS
jgi:hypothetical protein